MGPHEPTSQRPYCSGTYVSDDCQKPFTWLQLADKCGDRLGVVSTVARLFRVVAAATGHDKVHLPREIAMPAGVESLHLKCMLIGLSGMGCSFHATHLCKLRMMLNISRDSSRKRKR